MEDALINLLGGLAIQRADDVLFLVGLRSNKPLVAQLVIDIFFIRLNPAIAVAHHRISDRVLINLAVCRDLARIARAADEGNTPAPEHSIDCRKYARVIARAEVDAHRVAIVAAHGL